MPLVRLSPRHGQCLCSDYDSTCRRLAAPHVVFLLSQLLGLMVIFRSMLSSIGTQMDDVVSDYIATLDKQQRTRTTTGWQGNNAKEAMNSSLLLPHPEHAYMPCLSQSTRANAIDSRECNVMVHVKVPFHRRRSPPVTKSNRTASLCLFIKNEQLYVNEYVDYHLAIGFDEILIYDNSPHFNLQEWGAAKALETQGRILLKHLPGMSKQLPAYNMCMQTSRDRNHTWVGILDTDEMLLLHQHEHVVDLLEEHCSSGVLSIYWQVFGHAYQTRYRPYPLPQRFRYRGNSTHYLYKSFGKISDIVNADVHFIKVNKTQTDGNGQLVTQHDVLGRNLNYLFNNSGSDVPHQIKAGQVATVSHYWLKSVEEWFIKACWRGRPILTEGNTQKQTNTTSTETANSAQYYNCQKSMAATADFGLGMYDDRGWQALKRYVPEYAILDQYW